MDAHGYMYKLVYSDEKFKCIGEEEGAAAAAAEKRTQPVAA